MSPKTTDGQTAWRSKRFWVAGIVAAILVHAAGLFLFQAIPENGESMPRGRESEVVLVGPESQGPGNESLWEQALLRDSEPLFLPTGWNTSQALPAPALDRRPSDLFALYPPRWSYAETDFGLREESFATPLRSTLETYRQWGDPVTTLFGREERRAPVLSARQAGLELVNLEGETVRAVEVVTGDVPAALRQLWLPAVFGIQVGSVGVIGEPLLLRSSGVEEVDRFLREAVMDNLLRQWMPPTGYYRIIAGP